MNIDQAVQLLEQATALLKLDRSDHQKILLALSVIKTNISEKQESGSKKKGKEEKSV
jgi:hypothetical protein